MSNRNVCLLLLALLANGCGASPAPPIDFAPAEQTSLDRIISDIKRATREAYEQDDWSIMARLYPENTFACWRESQENSRFGFFSMSPIPDYATHEIGLIEDYELMGMQTAPYDATHYILIRYEQGAFEGCKIPARKLWPEEHFYLRLAGGNFTLVTLCPPMDDNSDSSARSYPVTSGKRAIEVADAMDAAERNELRELVSKDRFPLNAMNSLQRRYQLTEDESVIALDRICGQ